MVMGKGSSLWRGETFPDISFLPALANIFETSIDLLIGMDAIRATLCFLYLKCGRLEKASTLAAQLPHMRESREAIQPLISETLDEQEINRNIENLLLGKDEGIG